MMRFIGSQDSSSARALTAIRTNSPLPTKKGRKRLHEALCRFMRPVAAFSFDSRYVQLVTLKIDSNPISSEHPFYMVRALRAIDGPPASWDVHSFIWRDTRCLEFIHSRPLGQSSVAALHRDPLDFYLPLESAESPNSWFSECNAALTVGSGAHNHMYMMDYRDLGGAAYLSKYLVKNNLKPEKSLSILYEAIRHVNKHPSIAADARSDPGTRRMIHIVQRVLNSSRGAIELSMPLLLGSLLGMKQFETSYSFKSVFLTDAVDYVKRLLRNVATSGGEWDEVDAVAEEPEEETANVDGTVEGDEPGEFEDEDEQAQLARDSNGQMRFVSQKIDYAFRDARLVEWNLVEFSVTFYKVPNKRPADAMDPASSAPPGRTSF